jgi:hypothetical protein
LFFSGRDLSSGDFTEADSVEGAVHSGSIFTQIEVSLDRLAGLTRPLKSFASLHHCDAANAEEQQE